MSCLVVSYRVVVLFEASAVLVSGGFLARFK